MTAEIVALADAGAWEDPRVATASMPLCFHMSYEPIETLRFVEQGEPDRFFKPNGLWISDESDYGWSHWTADVGFYRRHGRPRHSYSVRIKPGSDVLWIKDQAQLVRFEQEFDRYFGTLDGFRYRIDWARVAERFQGILITPHLWECRWGSSLWYSAWNCASGCIWDPEAIAEITKIEAFPKLPRQAAA
ncbi:hypothetical protein IHQ68_04485 [Chelatococcus sambhunathii]|uniref:Uncharacterized protein n=1 Tax=Chelatococcus sambhunathii TaxID=363953 RepID=A0ABU1DCQ3_9HYPH|nr:hypothetical protein [Chelatococcus sambhunathii]MDR4305883.1 hypothetical protein [Chelatococcus sambhunathii]